MFLYTMGCTTSHEHSWTKVSPEFALTLSISGDQVSALNEVNLLLQDENLQRTFVVRDDTKNAFPPFPDSIPSNTSKQQQQPLGAKAKGSHSQATGYSGHSFSDFSDASYSYATSTQEEYEDILYSLPPGQVYQDPEFPANNEALYLNPRQQVFGDIQWLRPQEILGDKFYPEFVIDGVTQGDIRQGILGDCWFLSSCAAVSKRKKIMSKIIPKNQALSGPQYKGVVRFFFWRFGQWVQVIIDDRLPTVKRKLIFGRCTHPREFWVPLIEKAYAKLYGCYEALGGGITMDALVDLTGGLAERFELVEHDPSLFRFIHTARRAGGFIACSRKGDWRLSNVADPNGLIPGHAYTIINTLVVNFLCISSMLKFIFQWNYALLKHKMGEEKMVCIRNPWGDGAKWKGSWSDHDVNWQWVDEDVRESILGKLDSAEFWMSFRDFYHQFGEVTICHLSPDFDGDVKNLFILFYFFTFSPGHTEMIWGEWILGKTAGGSRNNLNKFATNDQYLLSLTDMRMNDFASESKQNIVISLMQEHRQISKNVKPMMYQIGFFLYQTSERLYKLPLQYFRFNSEYAKTSFFINYREVSGRFELDPGCYVIIPSTFIEDCPSHFLLRVFGEKRFSLKGPLLSR
ncbi:unnamed protein product [Lymnaea stagnalis]|uniref:Calpain catalytic domain-containing protein n=1 Tax=Lymnaea stagnalis TaxID=6523 RepID=A0AAV2HRY1_LYMST